MLFCVSATNLRGIHWSPLPSFWWRCSRLPCCGGILVHPNDDVSDKELEETGSPAQLHPRRRNHVISQSMDYAGVLAHLSDLQQSKQPNGKKTAGDWECFHSGFGHQVAVAAKKAPMEDLDDFQGQVAVDSSHDDDKEVEDDEENSGDGKKKASIEKPRHDQAEVEMSKPESLEAEEDEDSKNAMQSWQSCSDSHKFFPFTTLGVKPACLQEEDLSRMKSQRMPDVNVSGSSGCRWNTSVPVSSMWRVRGRRNCF